LSTLYSFTGGSDGSYPFAGLTQTSDGNLLGTTYEGGSGGYGTVFRIATSGSLTTLYSFTNGSDGGYPYGRLIQAADGSVYGATGNAGSGGDGTVYVLSLPDTPKAITFTNNPLTGGVGCTGTVILASKAPAGGTAVSLSSSASSVAQPVVSSISIPYGAISGTFNITSSPVSAVTPVTFTASANGTSATAVLHVRPIPLQSLTISPASVTGGSPATGRVTLTQNAAPGPIRIYISSDNPAAAKPASRWVTIRAGERSAAFSITTFTVAGSTSVTFHATADGTTKSADITVNP
ncbi:MAG TPA: choice-of-anchor tandem repeat GloVer-containing protein, partial [Chthonomonadales bacterium]|nr:choice-of-anchor tandem repeat GloVer-containing protein [Chthonomonadales bacterium]